MKARKYTIAVLQLNLNNTPENNLEKCKKWVREAAAQGAEVISLPELYSSHYFCQDEDVDNFKYAEPLYDISFTAFSALAKELGVVIIVPFFEKRMSGIYHNSAYIIDTDGSEAGLYRKMHIPDDPHFYEKFYFTPGDLGFKTIKTKKSNLGTLICWDQWYPEAARLTALQGAEVLFYPTAIGWHPQEKAQYGVNQHGAWMNVMKGHAVANGVYVAAANRIGLEKYVPDTNGIEFWGQSFICGPQGEILAQASVDQEEILMAEIDLDLQENVRQNWPFFRDRRIDFYGEITKRALD
ncbi:MULTISPECIES: carbon-nitrogen hydrolase [unclassified Leeuwenhoekiella]|uniref:carbon-nitrogen hydrolase n=1 Tax=unclassified Leeuwenhoekiella TaxID=2615029 RepID=UPI000C3914C6|nr:MULTISPECIES: carbon-nitrogen hydrolase [unclassified Leeuwenhoekiella]MAW95331.1 acyltransferase [Leeuwenhoekiella sp.]MBA81745.1 acyltransferase [Leeuwenhoekiella sp.]|tara:strand:+ start:13422 stop:14309 length:888 start_codon:yes stop_codon:yes gene_type:complete